MLKVFDESKQSMSLKNKGRYEINYNFVLDTTKNPNIADLLSIVPNRGVLVPTERPTQVAVVFKSRSEITFKDETLLKCQVNEMNGFFGIVFLGGAADFFKPISHLAHHFTRCRICMAVLTYAFYLRVVKTIFFE